MKESILSKIKVFFAIFVALMLFQHISAEETESTVTDYLWEKHSIPDNKFTLLDFIVGKVTSKGPDGEEGQEYEMSGTGGPWNVVARQINKDKNELNIILSYLTIAYDRPKFVIEKNHAPGGGDAIYFPKSETPGKIEPVNGERYDLEKLTAETANQFSYFMIGEDEDHQKELHGSEAPPIFIHKQIYNVMVTLGFDNDEFEDPTYVSFTYEVAPKNDGKPVFIGTLAQTVKGYEDDGYGGWNTWVSLEAQGKDDSENPTYPYTYTFKPNKGDTEYDLSVFLKVPSPLERNDDALMVAEKELWSYLSFWSDEYESTTNLYQKDANLVDIEHDLGQTKPFPGTFGPSYSSNATSIHLRGLEDNKVYRLTVGDPSTLWWNNQLPGQNDNNASRFYLADALAWISLMEYTPEVKAYQLVEFKGETNEETTGTVYYTFDAERYKESKKSQSDASSDDNSDTQADGDAPVLGKTYRIILNEAKNELVSCTEVDNIDEATAYKPQDYIFTDLLFVRTEDPEWMSHEDVDIRVVDMSGNITVNQNEITVNQNEDGSDEDDSKKGNFYKYKDNNEVVGGFLYSIIPMRDVKSPLDKLDITLQKGYTYDFSTKFEKDYKHAYLKYIYNGDELEYDENGKPKYEVVASDSKEPINVVIQPTTVGEDEGLKNQAVEGAGQLAVPTPASEEVSHSLKTVEVIDNEKHIKHVEGLEKDGKQMIAIRLYAEDLKGYDEKNLDYWEVEYALPTEDKSLIHSHDYDVTFQYFNPNLSDFLGKIAKKEKIEFRLTADDGQNDQVLIDYTNTDTNTDTDTPMIGYYNAHMGYIYESSVNQETPAERTLHLEKSPSFDYYYERWENDMTATVVLNLNAPTIDLESEENGQTKYLKAPELTESDGWVAKAILLSAPKIKNTTDYINNTLELTTGDDDEDYTTLYLAEFPDSEPELFTKEELINKIMRTALAVKPIGENETINDVTFEGKVDICEIRNVYLFPYDKNGLTTPSDKDDLTTPSIVAAESFIKPLINTTEEDLPIYHGVTTPPQTITAYLSSPKTSGVNDIEISISENIAKAGLGEVEILVDGASLYRVDGTQIDSAVGVHSVTPGVYIVRKGAQTQKLFVR